MNKKIEIFRPGRFTTMSGEELTFTKEDVLAIAEGYDTAKFEAPFVVGHPKDDAPAYGWAKALEFTGGVLRAVGHQVESQFSKMVNDGRFKKISASLFRPDDPNNPNPGKWYLRHIGFLGAAAPAVPGLKPVALAGADEAVVVEFGAIESWGFGSIARMMRSVREFLIETSGKEKADSVLPSYQIDEIDEVARRLDEPAGPETSFSTPEKEIEMEQKELQEQQKKLQEDQAAFAEQQKQFKQQQEAAAENARKALAAEAAAFCDGLVKQGKILAAHSPVIADVLTRLPADAQVEFSDGDSKTKKTLTASFKGFLESLPAKVEFGEVAPTSLGDPQAQADSQPANFATEDLSQYV